MANLTTRDANLRQFCTFRIEHRLYGIDVEQVREVSTMPPLAMVPHAPSAVRGLVNLRSRIYLVLDLRPVLGYAPANCTADSRLVILKSSVAENTGILVDQGGDIISATPDCIESAYNAVAGSGDNAQGERAEVDALPSIVTDICKLESALLMVVSSLRLIDHVKHLLSGDRR